MKKNKHILFLSLIIICLASGMLTSFFTKISLMYSIIFVTINVFVAGVIANIITNTACNCIRIFHKKTLLVPQNEQIFLFGANIGAGIALILNIVSGGELGLNIATIMGAFLGVFFCSLINEFIPNYFENVKMHKNKNSLLNVSFQNTFAEKKYLLK